MKSTILRFGREGFTLIEILVALILLALLAAAVFPVVTQQVGQGDPTRTANDLANIRSGIEQFSLDVRPSSPGDLDDLVHQINSPGDSTLNITSYSANQETRWNGPYIDAAVADSATGTGPAVGTAYGGVIRAELLCYDGSTNARVAGATCDKGDFITLVVVGPDSVEFEDVNDLVDGTLEVDGTATGNSGRSGKLRWTGGGAAGADGSGGAVADTTYYLAAPFRK